MPSRVTRLSPSTRNALRIGAVACFAIALFLIFSVIASFESDFDRVSNGGRPTGGPGLTTFFLGGLFLMAGSVMARFGFLKPVSEIVATETQGAVEVTGAAIGRGLAQSGILGGAAPTHAVKVRCRSCNFLESEDAKFCSNCRAMM